MTEPLSLAIFQYLSPNGATGGSWRHPDNRQVDYLDLDHWIRLAKQFEEAGFDFLFFADSYGYPVLNDAVIPKAIEDAINMPQGDPVVLVSALAAATERLGFVITSSTTVEKPQALTRRLTTLDHLTKGRLGWNIVTGSAQASSARLFGEPMVPHDERYAVADDHVQLSLKLWEGTWDDGALKVDRAAGVYADPALVHEIHHEGPYFKADGLLSVPPSPQRTPLLLQAGTSGPGRDFAARYAEAVFLAGGDPVHVAANIADIRRRAEGYGRGPDAIRFLIGATFIVGRTNDEAAGKREEQLSLTSFENAATAYAYFTGIDLLSMDLDQPLGGVGTEQGQSSVQRYQGENGAPRPTVREIIEDYRHNGVNGTVFVGDPEGVADQVEELIAVTKADGFLVQPYLAPTTYDDFIDLLMPVLRARGLLKPGYAGETLREHLFGVGNRWLPAEHPGASFRAAALAPAE